MVAHRHKLAVAEGDTSKIISLSPRRAPDPARPVGGDQHTAFVLLRRAVPPNTYRHKLAVAISDAGKPIWGSQWVLDAVHLVCGSQDVAIAICRDKLAVAIGYG